jgi:hypothetical protein
MALIRSLMSAIGRRRRKADAGPGGDDLAAHQAKEGLALRSRGQDENTSIIVRGDLKECVEAELLCRALSDALDAEGKNHAAGFEDVLKISGFSGRRYRRLINRMISLAAAPRYLEIGSWAGSTACAAMHGNRVEMTCVDNWSEFNGPREWFFQNIEANLNPATPFSFLEGDFRNVDFRRLGPFNVYLFDGPHTEEDQYDGVRLVQPALAETFVLIVDDWNWEEVRRGTLRAIADEKLRIFLSVEIRTSQDNSQPALVMETSDWHNGYFLCVCRKRPQP